MSKFQLQPSTSTFLVEDQQIYLVKKRIKRINLTVHYLTGKVRVSAPLSTKLDIIHDFVFANLVWIKKQQKKIEFKTHHPVYKYVTGEVHFFSGEQYFLNIVEHNAKPKIDLSVQCLTMYIRPESTIETRKVILDTWYREQLNMIIPVLIEKYEPLMQVKVAEFGIKKMKTRWGTCNTRARRIWLNLELAKKSPECLEYIVVHEMVHLLEASHNHRFKSLMTMFMPQWKLYKQQLNLKTVAICPLDGNAHLLAI